MEAISVKNLSVAYENNTIIEDMSLSIPKEKISIIIGANGCGKSTLLKTIARINKPKSGDIFINNKNIKKVKEYSKRSCILTSRTSLSRWTYSKRTCCFW